MSIISIDINAQRAFSPLCPDELPVAGGDLIAPELNRNAALAHWRVLTRDAHGPNAVWVVEQPEQMGRKLDYPNADQTWVRHAEVGTAGFLPLPGLPQPEEYDFLVHQGLDRNMHPYGCCFHDTAETLSTGLLEWLQVRQADCLIVGGLATDYSVKETVVQLCRYGNWQVLVNLASCRGIAEDTVAAALQKMREVGAFLLDDANAVADWLKQHHCPSALRHLDDAHRFVPHLPCAKYAPNHPEKCTHRMSGCSDGLDCGAE